MTHVPAAGDLAAGEVPGATPDAGVEPVAVARGELVDAAPNVAATSGDGAGEGDDDRREAVEEPAKVMRIGSMIKQLLEEVRGAELDAPARERLREIYETSVRELGSAMSPDLREELERVALPFDQAATPSDAELRVVQAQLVGWLEGLFHGIQATLFAQQMAARHQLEDMRRQLPGMTDGVPTGGAPTGETRPGTYL